MYLSILGDSISTYAGYNPPGHAVFFEGENLMRNGLQSVEDTWWAIVLRQLGAALCVNNSYSGGRVSGAAFPAANCLQRACRLHTAHINPDVILLYIGFNDFGYGVPLAGAQPGGPDCTCFWGAYLLMLRRIRQQYPGAAVVCGTLMKGSIKDNPAWPFPEVWYGSRLEDFNSVIRDCCRRENCLVADLAALGLRYETLDGTHPTRDGHRTIADAWLTALGQCAPFLKMP